MKYTIGLAVLVASMISFGAARSNAVIVTYNVPLFGSEEVPGPGDPDGSGSANLILDSATNSISWNITVSNLDAVILDHIHQAPSGVAGPVVIDFGGLLVGSTIDPDVANVLANPTGFYVNVHTTAFTAGAIRGQIPEPATAGLLSLGLLGLGAAGRRRTR